MSEMFSRRSFLKLSGALVAASALAACSDGGGSSNGGGGSGGGGGADTSTLHDVGDGLKLNESISAVQTELKGGPVYPYLSIKFENTTDGELSITASQFTDVSFDGNPVAVCGVNRSQGQFVHTLKVPAKGSAYVSLYLNAPADELSYNNQPISFCYSHNNGTTKVRCTGKYNFSNAGFKVDDNVS